MSLQKVLVEIVDFKHPSIVNVIPYSSSFDASGCSLGIMSREEVEDEFEVVGEISNGELRMYNESKDDYYDDDLPLDDDEEF